MTCTTDAEKLVELLTHVLMILDVWTGKNLHEAFVSQPIFGIVLHQGTSQGIIEQVALYRVYQVAFLHCQHANTSKTWLLRRCRDARDE
jgi:hypothetical protein